MAKQKRSLNEKSAQYPDGRKFSNRNAAKWPLDVDELLSGKVRALQEQGYTKNQALHILSRDKDFVRLLPPLRGAHRLADSPEKIYARLAKRMQQITCKAPEICRIFGIGLPDMDVATVRDEIEKAMGRSLQRLNPERNQ